MSDTTDLRVEAVARAIEATMFAPHELPITGELHERYRETARAALGAIDATAPWKQSVLARLEHIHRWFCRECAEPNPMTGEVVEADAREPFRLLCEAIGELYGDTTVPPPPVLATPPPAGRRDTTKLVRQLREEQCRYPCGGGMRTCLCGLMDDAADAIEAQARELKALHAQIAEAREALEPFAAEQIARLTEGDKR